MRAYLQTHEDTRYVTYLSFPLVQNEIKDPAFQWEETGKEFSYQGEMYDVISVKTSNDSFHICAIKDDRENELEKQIASIRHTKNDSGSNPVFSLLKFFSAFDIADTAIVFPVTKCFTDHIAKPYDDLISSGTEIHSPPPRC